MRKLLLTFASAAACLAAFSPALTASALSASPVKAKARVAVCVPSLDQTQRFAVFQGEMQAVKGANRMQMRFTLLQQLPGEQFKLIDGTGLGVWNSARANIKTYRFRKRVENLVAPAAYRAVISFRWLARNGKVARSAVRVSPTCRQPDLRPNLKPGQLNAKGNGRNRPATYNFAVRNFGRTAASNFDVAFTINGEPRPAQTVASINRSGGRHLVSIAAPRCTQGTSVKVVIDPDNRVAETNESDNELVVACPFRN